MHFWSNRERFVINNVIYPVDIYLLLGDLVVLRVKFGASYLLGVPEEKWALTNSTFVYALASIAWQQIPWQQVTQNKNI